VKHLKVTKESVEEVKYLICDKRNMVDKSLWEFMLQWFSPLYPQGEKPENIVASMYDFDDVVNIVSPLWFFGFIEPIEANNILDNTPSGTFLFRFSSQPGHYTLSVSNDGQVGHWRLRADKGPTWQQFCIENRYYESFQNIIDVHMIEPLKVKLSNSSRNSVKLIFPCQRKPQIEEDSVYSML